MAEQPDPNAERLQNVDSAFLTPIVQKSIDDQNAVIVNWTYTPVNGGFGGGMGGTYIYRFRGDVQTKSETKPWSLMLKIVRARPDEDPASTHYWKREVEIYQSRLLENLPGRFLAVRTFGVLEYPDEAGWIWMEDLTQAVSQPWSLEQYGRVARHLGQFNGLYLTTRPIPSDPWLSTEWLRKIFQVVQTRTLEIQNMLKAPTLQDILPSDAETQFLRLWSERERFLSALDNLPQTFCHQDAVARNLFARYGSDGEYDTIAIDWAYAGRAAVGMEIVAPLVIALIWMEVNIVEASNLAGLMYDNYLLGLQDSGWTGNEQQVRLGFAAGTVCKYMEMLMIYSYFLTDAEQIPVLEQILAQPASEIISAFAGAMRLAFSLADEARQLMDALEL
jgi:hypothetical protein